MIKIIKGETLFAVIKRVSNSERYRHVTVYQPTINDNTFEEGENRITMHNISFDLHKLTGITYKDKTQSLAIVGEERLITSQIKSMFEVYLETEVKVILL